VSGSFPPLALPVWLQAVVVIGTCAAAGAVATVIARRLWLGPQGLAPGDFKNHNDFMGAFSNKVAVLYAVILAFVIFGVWGRASDTQQTINLETSALTNLYFDTSALPAAVRDSARQAIRAYTNAVVTYEWTSMARGEPSSQAETALLRLHEVYRTARSGSSDEQVLLASSSSQVNDITRLRTQRVMVSRGAVPDIFWLTLLIGGIATLALSGPLFLPRAPHQVFISVAYGATIGAILFLILILDHPFSSGLVLSADGLRHALQLFSG
jgi:hypothetical protein